MKNRNVSFIFAFLLLTSLLMINATAATYASDQIQDGWAIAEATSGGEIAVEFQVDGTGKMLKLGASVITLYEKKAGTWYPIETVSASEDSNMVRSDAFSHCNTTYFRGIAGRQYYASVTVFATDARGTDYRTYSSNTVTAK
ncbi:MAG: hypothetical protein K2N63_06595 [Lachnospiraceae bacterium]|nr:hypothetical protein [Lachnospiraceae bacterium]